MKIRRTIAAALIAAALLAAQGGPGGAQTGPVKIALITDMTGSYAGLSGPGAELATKMAIEDFGGKILGRSVEVVAIDHRNNAADAAIKAREQFDSGAELALDLTNSGVALAVAGVAKEKKKLAIVTGAGSTDLTGAQCNKYTYHYAYDTYSLAHATGTFIANQPKGKTWYGIAANYAFGKSLLDEFSAAIAPEGGKITKADMYPFPGTTDFSSYLLAAKNSGDQVLGLFNAGADTVNSMKQAKQFGIDKSMRIAIALLFISDVDALPDVFDGARITTSWYWNEDKAARNWSDRFAKRFNGVRPTDVQAADYSATMNWLNAAKAVNSLDADKIVAYLDGRKFSDFYAHRGEWRVRDHRVVHDMYVVDVLGKNELKEPHGWFKIVQTIPPDKAFRPVAQAECKKDW